MVSKDQSRKEDVKEDAKAKAKATTVVEWRGLNRYRCRQFQNLFVSWYFKIL